MLQNTVKRNTSGFANGGTKNKIRVPPMIHDFPLRLEDFPTIFCVLMQLVLFINSIIIKWGHFKKYIHMFFTSLLMLFLTYNNIIKDKRI